MFSRLDDPVRVEVGTGDDLRSFTVHGAFLTFRSLFFRKALSGAWKEAKERLIKLPEDDSDTFELYLQVVYGLPMSIEPNPLFDEYPGRSEQEALAKLYVFAEKVQDVRAKNTIMKAFLKSVWKVRSDGLCYVPARGSIHVIYEGSTPGSSMRRLLVDIYAYGITHEERFKGYHQDFLTDVAAEMTKARLTYSSKGLKINECAEKYLETEEKMND